MASSGVVSGGFKLLLVTTTAHGPQWSRHASKHMQQTARRLASYRSAQTLCLSRHMCEENQRATPVPHHAKGCNKRIDSLLVIRRMFSTAPPADDRKDKKEQEETDREEERMTLKRKLAADIETARNLVNP